MIVFRPKVKTSNLALNKYRHFNFNHQHSSHSRQIKKSGKIENLDITNGAKH